eukprot:15081036-Alexandrium_andersonii.AAC.1
MEVKAKLRGVPPDNEVHGGPRFLCSACSELNSSERAGSPNMCWHFTPRKRNAGNGGMWAQAETRTHREGFLGVSGVREVSGGDD